MSLRFGREVAGALEIAEGREWLVTNGIGGYASGTVAGTISRGYHGLLVAAIRPPGDRRLMCVKLDETLTYREASCDLGANRWQGGGVAPAGYANIQSFELEASIPTWRFACADALLDKRIWMEYGANTTYVAYTLVSAAEPVRFSARAIVDNRVFHNTGEVAWPVQVESHAGRARISAGARDSRPLVLAVSSGEAHSAGELYRDYYLPAETRRGLRDFEDHVHGATFEAVIAPGETLLFLASAEENPSFDNDPLARRRARDESLRERWARNRKTGAEPPPEWAERLVYAADQFIVDRPAAAQPDGKSVIAGYHWFEDWGRDTMISLPGLALATGRAEVAASILRTFAGFASRGMLPNRFPDGSDQPQYNTIDAALWYFQAIRACHEATADDDLLRELFPVLEDIVDWHVRGTRYGISVDPVDGLLRGGEEGVQLTWMDARVGERVITPRIGKPVEVNALWYNALRTMVYSAVRLGRPAGRYEMLSAAARAGFARFWNPGAGYCYDVLDGPNGADEALRPNQIFAVSLPESPLTTPQQRAVVDACARSLLTSSGLRSLAPSDAAFHGRYGGNQYQRDGAYHQGTVWAWLMGPFVSAHLRVYRDTAAAHRLLEPFGDHLHDAGIGTISEIFDGTAPFAARGCVAQAWSVAEVLRALDHIAQVGEAGQA
jgi:predicted glycogen debranching enzyme